MDKNGFLNAVTANGGVITSELIEEFGVETGPTQSMSDAQLREQLAAKSGKAPKKDATRKELVNAFSKLIKPKDADAPKVKQAEAPKASKSDEPKEPTGDKPSEEASK